MESCEKTMEVMSLCTTGEGKYSVLFTDLVMSLK
jgi:hypothetical protein